jgi:hypothetical protein
MGTHSSPEKKPLQRKRAEEDHAIGKTAQPPAFELSAEASQMKPAQLQEDPEAQKATPTVETPAPEPEKELSEGDKLRASVAAKAEEWNGKEFMTQQEIEDTRVRTGMKNFTTCLEFAGKMMRDGNKELYGRDWKKQTATTMAFSNTKADWEAAVGQRIQADGFGKSVAMFDKAIARIEGDKAKFEKEVGNLRRPKDEGESDISYKQRTIRAEALEKHTIKALESVIRQQKAQRDKWQGKSDKAKEKAEMLDANNTAMIKAEDGMTNGRPKPGEYIILAQAPGGTKYGQAGSKVFLHGGSFKHIAVFMEVLKEDDGSGYELWRTIDGGGTNGKETKLRVRIADRMIFPGQGDKLPDVGSASGSQLAGWMDMDKIVEKRDQKMAEGKK